ncbi:MAG: hypothetical protein IJS59_04055 [Bacteroidaceae bacterium]|nr:hypothetical protein [Bacteroidaceae bacterium]
MSPHRVDHIIRRLTHAAAHAAPCLAAHAALLLVAATLLLACSQTETSFSRLPARLVVSNTNTIPQLNAALGNPGEYCTIEQRAQSYRFTNLVGFTEVNRTAMANYQSAYFGLSGFIVGTPSIPEPGQAVQQVVCFDLSCPNCYDNYAITKSMTLKEGGRAACASCSRTYDLNTQGIVAQGDPGKSLFRYRVTYAPYTLQINN